MSDHDYETKPRVISVSSTCFKCDIKKKKKKNTACGVVPWCDFYFKLSGGLVGIHLKRRDWKVRTSYYSGRTCIREAAMVGKRDWILEIIEY